MKKFKGLMISTAVLLCTAIAGTFQANAGIGIWGDSYGTFCSGDINQDDECTVADAVLMQQYLLGSLSKENKFILANVDLISTADLNLDGEIDVFDFIIMRDCLVNSDKQNIISWYVDENGVAGTTGFSETVGNEYIFTSYSQLTEYLDSIAYGDYTEYSEKYTADFFEDNILLMKPVFEDTMNNFYSINKIFYDGDTMNIDYTYNYGGEISEELGDPVLLQVAVPKSRYHAEEISWNRKEADWEPLVEFAKKSNITQEEFFDLLLSKEEFTWSDFEQYRSYETADGLEYEVDFEDDSEKGSVFLVGENRDEKPENIYFKSYSDGKIIDIYEFKQMIAFLESLQRPENNETNRNNVQKIADYAFSGLQNGTFDLQTVLFSEDITDNEELLNLWQESRVLYFEFVDEHTVKISLDGGGFFDVYGYLVTDGTVEYEIGWNDNIDVDYDGGGVDVRERNGNLYFFHAGT